MGGTGETGGAEAALAAVGPPAVSLPRGLASTVPTESTGWRLISSGRTRGGGTEAGARRPGREPSWTGAGAAGAGKIESDIIMMRANVVL